MSQTVITAAFEEWKAQEAAGGNRVVLDGFVLANVPGLDPDVPVSNTETLPPDDQIVYRQDVGKCGVVNNNAVVYSITMGSNIGTFDFNWIGLVNKASGVLAMIVHTPMQRKLKTQDGQQGNAVNRSFLMEYDGAATETEINTPAQTWQIDFTARLSGMDEEWRLANVDIYGSGAFFGDGFLVKKDGSKYKVQPGNGYIGGVRATLNASEEITAASLPAKVFADVSWQGALTGRWQAVTVVQASTAELADYIDGDGFAHYVFAVASIDIAGVVTDLRPIGSLPAQTADSAVKSVNKEIPNEDGDVTLTADDVGAVKKTGDIMTGPLKTKSTITVYEDDVLTVSEFLYSYKENGSQVNKISIKAICDADGSGHWVVEVNSPQTGDKRVQAFGIDGKSKLVATMNGFQLYEGAERVYSKNNPPPKQTAADTGAMPYFGTALSVDLNTLGPYAAAGVHYQPSNAGATAASHYPVVEAGSLLITPSAYGCQQEYTTFGTRRKFIRGLSAAWNGTNGPWEDWNELYGPTNPNEIVSPSANSFRIAYNGYGTFWRNDGIYFYLMLTNHNDPHGNYNALRPFRVNVATGESVMHKLNLEDFSYFDSRYLKTLSLANTGAVGTLALLCHDTALGLGATAAGSTLHYSGFGAQKDSYGDHATVGRLTSPQPAGTWKCLGIVPAPNNNDRGASLFCRIS